MKSAVRCSSQTLFQYARRLNSGSGAFILDGEASISTLSAGCLAASGFEWQDDFHDNNLWSWSLARCVRICCDLIEHLMLQQ